MPITEDRISKLRDFGLSEYAARAYLALLDLGLTEAREVSTLSKVPTSKIYHILDQLHEKGLVIVLPEFPKKYAPVPFHEFLDKLQREHEEAARTIERERDDLASVFPVLGNVDIGDRGSFSVVRGRRNTLEKIGEIVRNTSRDLFVLGSRGIAHRYEYLLDDVKRLADRGVRLRFVVPLPDENVELIGPLAEVAEVRARDTGESAQGENVAILVSDAARAFIIHFVPDDGHLYQGKDTAFYTDHDAMVAALQAVVEPHWSRAMPFEVRRREVAEDRDPEFTRVHMSAADVQRAVLDTVSNGVRELRIVDALPVGAPAETPLAIAERLQEVDGRFRVALNLHDAATVRALMDALARFPGSEVRHADPGAFGHLTLMDEREALFSAAPIRPLRAVGGAAGESHLVIHTSNPPTVKALSRSFEELWASARPLDARLKELESEGGGIRLTPGSRSV